MKKENVNVILYLKICSYLSIMIYRELCGKREKQKTHGEKSGQQ